MSEPTTILILSHNRSWSLLQCVASIREWTRAPYHIVIQDHQSDEKHWPMIQNLEADDCTVLRADAFLSCNEGRRLGLDHVQGKHVVFLDDDLKVERAWLSRMLRPMLKDPEIGAVCGQMVQNFGNERMSWARMLDRHDAKRLPFGFTGYCDFCGGGATLYRTEALRQTEYRGEFDGTGEDWDQILQMRLNEWKVFCADVTFFHFHQKDYDEYGSERWRFTEIMDSAIGLWKRWGIKTVVAEQAAFMITHGIPFRPEQREAIKEIIDEGKRYSRTETRNEAQSCNTEGPGGDRTDRSMQMCSVQNPNDGQRTMRNNES